MRGLSSAGEGLPVAVDVHYAQVVTLTPPRVELLVIDLCASQPTDPSLPASPTLAFLLLLDFWMEFGGFWSSRREPGTPEPTCPLTRDLGPDWYRQHSDDSFVRATAPRYIASVVAHEQRRRLFPVQSCEGSYNGPRPEAVYEVMATNARWVEHLRVGMELSTTSYRME
jgi:hypothetical protein